MEGLYSVKVVAPTSVALKKAETVDGGHDSLAQEMKDIRKAKLQRKLLEDSTLAGELVATMNSPIYNASGEIIQAVSTRHMGV